MVGNRKGAPDDVHALRCYVAYREYRAEEDKRIKMVLEAASKEDLRMREQVEEEEQARREGRSPVMMLGGRAHGLVDSMEPEEGVERESIAMEGESAGGSSSIVLWEQPGI